jgi:hypothetical protein
VSPAGLLRAAVVLLADRTYRDEGDEVAAFGELSAPTAAWAATRANRSALSVESTGPTST